MITLSEKLIQWLVEEHRCTQVASDADDDTLQNVYGTKTAELLANGELTPEQYTELTLEEAPMATTAEKLFDRTDHSDPRIRVKNPSERYSEKRYVAKHRRTGEPVYDAIHQRECLTQSEASKARAGCLLKLVGSKAGLCTLNEHEKSLLNEMAMEDTWCGKMGGEFHDSIPGGTAVKQLLDDLVSFGLELCPIEFDSDIVSFPLLTGELYPQVDVKPVARGRRIEGASVNTPTLAWGGGDNVAVVPFATGAMCAPIDTTIHAVDGAILLGRDFLSDAAVNVGAVLTGLMGERLTAELERVIAIGNGLTEPTGLFTSVGVGAVVAANGAAGPPTLADYINLLFGIGKQYRNRNLNVNFASNDVSYMRSRQIAVDPAVASTDQRPALSPLTEINNYMTLGWGHKIQNTLTNPVAAVAALKKYRLYRRIGLEIRLETSGQWLGLRNLAMLITRGRYGGQLMDLASCCRWGNGQA